MRALCGVTCFGRAISRQHRAVAASSALRSYAGSSHEHSGQWTAPAGANWGAAVAMLAFGCASAYWAADGPLAASCTESPGASAGGPLTRNFVADAAAIAAPSVVNISSISGGGLFMTGSAGSGFIITEVCVLRIFYFNCLCCCSHVCVIHNMSFTSGWLCCNQCPRGPGHSGCRSGCDAK